MVMIDIEDPQNKLISLRQQSVPARAVPQRPVDRVQNVVPTQQELDRSRCRAVRPPEVHDELSLRPAAHEEVRHARDQQIVNVKKAVRPDLRNVDLWATATIADDVPRWARRRSLLVAPTDEAPDGLSTQCVAVQLPAVGQLDGNGLMCEIVATFDRPVSE